MDFAMGNGGNSSGDEREAQNARKGKKSYHRHTTQQIQQLEEFFKECPHPDESQRRQLSMELGLEPKQIKFWFQNKRTQTKAQHERADNSTLRAENERVHCENIAIREALKNVICPSCGGPPFGEEERQRSLQKLQLENAHLKDEHEKVTSLLAKYIGKPLSQLESLNSLQGSSLPDFSPATFSNQAIMEADPSACAGDLNFNTGTLMETSLPYQSCGIPEMEKALIAEIATGAMDELIRLLQVNEPLWVKSPAASGRYVVHRDIYDKLFPKANHFKTSTARIESSKDTGVVTMSARQLVDMFLNSNKWMDLFPTIATKARMIQELEIGMLGNRTGTLQLMYEQMHILSPLVSARDFYFLRYCQQIEAGVWVIVDVSYDCFKENNPPSRSWRLPSGCMIQDMPNGCSKVTWVEHVEVDDRTLTHRLYRDLVCSGVGYGAERWIVTLQRMCDRFAFCMKETASATELGGVITMPEGRRGIMKLSHRMVQSFCGILSMSGKLDFPHLSEVNNCGVRVSVRNNNESGQPHGVIVSAATSLWLPLHPHQIFDFFRDENKRVQWDVLSNRNAVHEIAHISTGTHPGNCISIIRPFIPTETNMVMLQEICIDRLGSLIVYAPTDIPSINAAISGEDSSCIPILPSGFIISGDGRLNIGPGGGGGASSSSGSGTRAGNGGGGALLTVAFQILVSSHSSSKDLNVESVATVNTLISSTVQKIKNSLNCAGLD